MVSVICDTQGNSVHWHPSTDENHQFTGLICDSLSKTRIKQQYKGGTYSSFLSTFSFFCFQMLTLTCGDFPDYDLQVQTLFVSSSTSPIWSRFVRFCDSHKKTASWKLSIHPSIGTILWAENWCCLSSLLGCWAQSWTGRHSDTVYQHAGTHCADLGRMKGRVNPT